MNNKFLIKNSLSGNFSVFLVGLGIGLLAAMLNMGIIALLMTFVDLNETIITATAIVPLLTGSFMSSMYVGLKLKKGGLMIGVIVGFVILLLIQTLSFFVKGFNLNLVVFVKILLTLISSLAGGIYSVNRAAKRQI